MIYMINNFFLLKCLLNDLVLVPWDHTEWVSPQLDPRLMAEEWLEQRLEAEPSGRRFEGQG